MNTTLADLLDQFLLLYLDNIPVYSTNDDEHETHLRTILKRLKQDTLFAKQSKCSFGETEVEYLGHIVGGGNVRADPAKVSTMCD